MPFNGVHECKWKISNKNYVLFDAKEMETQVCLETQSSCCIRGRSSYLHSINETLISVEIRSDFKWLSRVDSSLLWLNSQVLLIITNCDILVTFNYSFEHVCVSLCTAIVSELVFVSSYTFLTSMQFRIIMVHACMYKITFEWLYFNRANVSSFQVYIRILQI